MNIDKFEELTGINTMNKTLKEVLDELSTKWDTYSADEKDLICRCLFD